MNRKNEVAMQQNEMNVEAFDFDNVVMKNYTSELVKLERGEIIKGFLYKELENLENTREGSEGFYHAIRVAISKDEEIIMAGGVLISAHGKIFDRHPEKEFVPVIIEGLGEVKAKNSSNKYTGYSVKSI